MEVIGLANKHPRVNILRPSIGVGGHCIPLDPWFIKEVAPENSRLIFTSRLINDERPSRIAARVRREVADLEGARIVAIGAAYKANTADTRESPALEIVRILRQEGYEVRHYDPLVAGMGYESLADAARGADCLVILVEHDEVLRELAEHREQVVAAMGTPRVLRFYPQE